MSTWSAKILLFISSSFLICQPKLAWGLNPSLFIQKDTFFGTPARNEFEYKFAVAIDKDKKLNVRKISQKVTKALQNLIALKKFKFDQQNFETYQLTEGFNTFVFKDLYIDTNDFAIKKANSAYRLRYRWVRQEKYYRNRLFPFLKVFYPDRCEIQFKSDYKQNKKDSTLSVQESRFEFRNQSNPFLKEQNAPSAPWPEAEFLPIALSGVYKSMPILPMKNLIHQLKISSKKQFELRPQLEVVTERYRTHLTIRSPWGVGPNPEHAFIITIDKASAQPKSKHFIKKSYRDKKLLEVEIEIDRNISTEINRVAAMKLGSNPISNTAIDFSRKAQNNIKHDLFLIKSTVSKVLIDDFKLTGLPTLNKYSRFVNWLE